MNRPVAFRLLPVLALALLPALPSAATAPAPALPMAELDLATLRSALIPKREVAADQFLKALPQADGRGVLIGIFDTGVDPSAPGMGVTTTGERKLVDMIDASGSGDVDTRTKRKPDANGRLAGLSGRALTLPAGVVNPSGEFRLGLKPASELFNGEVLKRVNERRAAARAAAASVQAAARATGPEAAALKAALAKAPDDRTRADRELVARQAARTALDEGTAGADPGGLHDCVLWHDGSQWRAVVDTDEDGDLRNERVLQPFGVAGEYGSFGGIAHTTFGIQVYEGGQVLSVVTVTGDHGTHVASIAAAHDPGERARDGVAPGARILSINIGDRRNGSSTSSLVYQRASALLAQNKADIVNLSYGGRSQLQDGRNASSRIYDALAERYGVLVVSSAGNSGPALGTASAPGSEASRVLGVGAYVSPEMGAALYSTLTPARAGALAFTSRGPTKDGDFGVDVMAPGGAIASVSSETLQGADLKNGTSMSSPSAAGVAALVLSAARQARVEAPAARLRAALIAGARPLPQEEPFTRGSGLVNAPGAWKKLQEMQSAPAFDAYYDLEVNTGTFTSQGRGLLLREAITQPRQRVSVRVTPAWPEAVPPARRVAFESDLRLKPSVPWITAPKTLHLTNGTRTVALVVDAPPVPAGAIGSLHVAQVDAFLAARPALGPVFSVPVTLIQPAPASAFRQHRLETALDLKPAVTQRHFVEAPARASRLRIWVRHRAKDSLSRSFNIHAVAFAAQTHVAEMEASRNAALEPGGELSFDLELQAGTVAEVAYTLGFANVGDASLDVRLEWLGAGLGTEPVLMSANSGWASVNLTPLADSDVKVEARLERAVHVFLPETSVVVPMDERAEWPASPPTPGPARSPLLVQRFTIDLKAPLTAHVLSPGDQGDAFGGGNVTLVHESGAVLYDGNGSEGVTGRVATLPKGKTFGLRHFSALEADLLKGLVHVPLRLSEAFKAPRPLPMRTSMRERFYGKPATTLKLKGGREETIYLQDTATDELARLEPRPAHILGSLILRDGENREVGRQPLVYLPGASPARVTNVEPKAKPVKDARSEVDKLADTLFDNRLAFVRDQRGNTQAAVIQRRSELLTALRAERPQDAAVVFEQALDAATAAGLASAVWPQGAPAATDTAAASTAASAAASNAASAGASPAAAPAKATAAAPAADLSRMPAVLALLDEARRLAGPETVAQHLGAPLAASADEAELRPAQEAEKKRIAGLRETLARTERLRADVHRAAAAWAPAWQALGEAKRWEPATGDKMTRALEALMHEQSGHIALALQAVEAQLKDEPADLKLQRQRVGLYQRLGWTVDAEREQRRLALQAQQRAEVNTW